MEFHAPENENDAMETNDGKDDEQLAFDKIISDFSAVLRTDYRQEVQNIQEQSFWLDRRWCQETGEIEEKFCPLMELLPTPSSWRMLVYGKPFFGKSLLCRSLATIWASNDNQQFEILHYHKLKDQNALTLEKSILDVCFNMLPEDSAREEEFKEAWKVHMSKTLLILDGYDRLDNKNKSLIKRFVVDNSYFDKACIVLTSRPDNDAELQSIFELQADISGLTRTTLSKMIESSSSDLQDVVRQCKVEELYGVSPFFGQVIAEVIQEEQPKSLYKLLDCTMTRLAKKENVDETVLKNIGKFMLGRLQNRRFVFPQKLLQDLLHDKWKSVRKLNIFVPVQIGKSAVSHLYFMVYFAVRYLREEWIKLNTREEKKHFLRTQLCLEDCSFEQVKDQEVANKMFFAGLIPEIVFDLKSGLFEMTQDVTFSAQQTAFHTQSLLFRVDRKRLPAFGIQEVEDQWLEESFELILNMLDFDDLTIYRQFYKMGRSDLRFLKFSAVNEDQDNVVVMCVVSLNPRCEAQIQEIWLDFLDSSVQQIYPFLGKVFEEFYSSPHLEKATKGTELIHVLVMAALECENQLFTQFSVGSNTEEPSSFLTIEVVSGQDSRNKLSIYCPEFEPPIVERYNSTSSEKILKYLKRCEADQNELVFSVNIKTTFSERRLKRKMKSTNETRQIKRNR